MLLPDSIINVSLAGFRSRARGRASAGTAPCGLLRKQAVSLLLALTLAMAALSALVCPSQARADDLADFEAARSLYDQQSYARAVDAFRLLVGSEPPRLTDPLLVLESRKYLAASLLFMGAEAEARAQFRLLLQQEPSYALDPLAFPDRGVHAVRAGEAGPSPGAGRPDIGPKKKRSAALSSRCAMRSGTAPRIWRA